MSPERPTPNFLTILGVTEYDASIEVTVLGGTIQLEHSQVPADFVSNFRKYKLEETLSGTGQAKDASYRVLLK